MATDGQYPTDHRHSAGPDAVADTIEVLWQDDQTGELCVTTLHRPAGEGPGWSGRLLRSMGVADPCDETRCLVA